MLKTSIGAFGEKRKRELDTDALDLTDTPD